MLLYGSVTSRALTGVYELAFTSEFVTYGPLFLNLRGVLAYNII